MAADTATVAEQEYLESMFWIDEAGLPMTGANIARAMQLSAPTVHEMVGRLIKDGYVERNPDKSLAFTEGGREKASYIVRRHRMIERFRLHDELMLKEQFKVRHDQKVFLDLSRQGAAQLAQVLKEDAEKTYIEPRKETETTPHERILNSCHPGRSHVERSQRCVHAALI